MLIEIIMDKIGFAVCHQLPQRCLSFGPVTINICARCNGIYLGFFIAALVLFSIYTERPAGLPPRRVMIFLLIFMASTLIDGLLSYLSIISTNNIIRFVTGFLCGASLMAIIYPVFVFQYFKNSIGKKILGDKGRLTLFSLTLVALMALYLARWEFMGTFFYYLSSFSVLFTFYFINLVVVLLVPRLAQKAKKLWSIRLALPSVLALALSAGELSAFYLLHRVAEKMVL